MSERDLDNLEWERRQGSGLQTHLGYRLAEWAPDFAVVELNVESHHCNRAGILHGGVITTLLDTACGYAVCFCPVPGNVRRSLTLSLTTNFIGQARQGMVRVEARKQGGGRKIVFTAATAYNAAGEIIATATGTFRYHRGSEAPEGVPRGN